MSKIVSDSIPYAHLRYCNRCCMPETNEGMSFDELDMQGLPSLGREDEN